MRYRKDYQLANDIDWFAECRDIPLHFASNGCMLPKIVDSRINRNIQHKIAEMSTQAKFEVTINKTEIRSLLRKGGNYDDYIVSFVEFAERGFVSIDTCRIGEQDIKYIVVAYPKNKRHLINALEPSFYEKLKVPTLEDETFFSTYLAGLWGNNM